MRDEDAEKIVVDLAVARNKRVVDLTAADFASDPLSAALLQKRSEDISRLTGTVRDSLIAKIERGTRTLTGTRGLVFLEEMDLAEFYARSRELKQAAENK